MCDSELCDANREATHTSHPYQLITTCLTSGSLSVILLLEYLTKRDWQQILGARPLFTCTEPDNIEYSSHHPSSAVFCFVVRVIRIQTLKYAAETGEINYPEGSFRWSQLCDVHEWESCRGHGGKEPLTHPEPVPQWLCRVCNPKTEEGEPLPEKDVIPPVVWQKQVCPSLHNSLVPFYLYFPMSLGAYARIL